MSTDDPYIEGFNDRQSTIMIFRRIQLSLGCVILGGIVVNIIKSIECYMQERYTFLIQLNCLCFAVFAI